MGGYNQAFEDGWGCDELRHRREGLDERELLVKDEGWQGKRRMALLESNRPRNTLLETHPDEAAAGGNPFGRQSEVGLGIRMTGSTTRFGCIPRSST